MWARWSPARPLSEDETSGISARVWSRIVRQNREKYVVPFVQASNSENVSRFATVERCLLTELTRGCIRRRFIAAACTAGQRPPYSSLLNKENFFGCQWAAFSKMLSMHEDL